jgi:hypothetical protein
MKPSPGDSSKTDVNTGDLSPGCQNPLVNMAYTLMEPLPVGLIITLISAAILRRKPLANAAPLPQS